MKISKFLKLVCLLLIVATAANGVLIPVSKAYAESISASNGMSNAKIVNEQAKTESTDNEGYTELKEKRTEYLKYYQLESKKYEAVSFGLPVHYFEDGQYKEIDNSLELVTDKNGKQKYVNKANSFKAEISPAIEDGWMASIAEDQYKISWSVDGLGKGNSASAKSFLTREQ